MIRAVIYDLDDLMVNSVGLHQKSWDVVLKDFNHNISELPEELSSSFMGIRVIDALKKIIKYFKLSVDIDDFNKKRETAFLKLVTDELESMPGLLESLKLFKDNNFKIALASSGTGKYIDLVLDKFKIREYFTIIVSGDSVKKGKPDPETYIVATKKLELKPEECLVLEDATNGIVSAKKAGCRCVAVFNPYSPPQDHSKADMMVKSLNDISINLIITI
ncbi:HAD family hydrolase [Patescibacteria group bacterium]